MKYEASFKLKLIYIFRINDEIHKDCLKIGETTATEVTNFQLQPNSKELNSAAKKRINQYTQTAGIKYELLHTELTLYTEKGNIKSFTDSEVHSVLVRSGIKRKTFDQKNQANEWFETDLATAKNAIKAVKEGRNSLNSAEKSFDQSPIVFRPEQDEAIKKTKKQFKKTNEMLWFAKMRFGKTLSALQVVKEHEFKRTLILTHRPVVDAGWFEDFGKIFYDKPEYIYGSKNKGENFETLENQVKQKDSKFIYFASIQDLRGSKIVGGNHDKNDEVFSTTWDFIIVDEAHEGTQTDLGKNVLKEVKSTGTKVLHLSGTPFNLLENYKEDEIFTWDYVMEQKAKAEWDKTHLGDPNPYASLPKLNIYTYNLSDLLQGFRDEEVAFNFREFFRVNDAGQFVHQRDVENFLGIMCESSADSNYPYSTKEFRENFRHSLWMLPGVKEAKALSTLLQSHPVFSNFNIVNVAGDGDEEEANEEALNKVQKAITNKPHETYSITLSCGRLTTGVSVKAWTAVFMLSGSHNTSASTYMQTIFRVQTPATINGKVKEECFVFDFAPDRTLKVIAETAKVSAKAGQTSAEDRDIMGEFLNFCPIISVAGSEMTTYNVNGMLEQLKKVYVERVVRNGFEDNHLYNDQHLMTLDEEDLQDFSELQKIIGSTKAMPKSKDVDLNNQGFTGEEYETIRKAEKKPKKQLTEEEKELLERKKEKKKQKDTAISILRGISIRMPLMIYGAEMTNEDEELNIENFTNLVDAQSWSEFMPKGVSKQRFNSLKKFYDPDIFRAAGKRIREMARAADSLTIEQRIERITSIFATFRNPDKETVLTPWRVVNMHLGDCLGGFVFIDEKQEKLIEYPRFISNENTTENVFTSDTKILEINSKSGLYPLYVTYNVYRTLVSDYKKGKASKELSIKEHQELWDTVLSNNVFVICKTPMAKSITKRTLAGFRKAKVNTRYFEDLVNQIKNKGDKFVKRIKRGQSYWNANEDNNMEFNAIVGNPPYQEMDGGNSVSAKPIYNEFVDISKAIKPDYISMIMPARWYAGGKGLDEFRENMLNDNRIKALFDYPNSTSLFKNVDIAGGLCYFLWDKNNPQDTCEIHNRVNEVSNLKVRRINDYDILIRDNRAITVLEKVLSLFEDKPKLSESVSSRKPFGLPTNYKPKEKGQPCWFVQKIGLKYAAKKDIIDNNNYLDKWKLLIPKAPIAGQTDFTKPIGFYYDGNTRIAKPGECCTESFIIAGAFTTENEVLSFKSYLFTKTVRFLLLQRVVSQDVTKKCFAFIPDLKHYSETFTDEKLCERWGITEDEWNYIDSRIHNY